MAEQTVLIAGASGVVGQAAVERFAAEPDWRVIGLSRRRPRTPAGLTFEHYAADLADRDRLGELGAALGEVSHLVYAALHEQPALVQGWREPEQMARNDAMLRNLLAALEAAGAPLRHVSLLQGTKAYGAHLHRIPTPARERAPRDPHENFYWLQEDRLRQAAARRGFQVTIFRPQIVYGDALGGAMNLIPVLGVIGALWRETGRPFGFPGGPDWIQEGVDADLLARALAWAAVSPAAHGETFNITNGDVYVWREVWPAIARALGLEPGPGEPLSIVTFLAQQADAWSDLAARHGLEAIALPDLIGKSDQYADMLFGYGLADPPPPALVSTIKIRQAGFGDCVDTEEMFHRALSRLAARNIIPKPA
jgi:nucleoside-diphosphate-sugar epimerase